MSLFQIPSSFKAVLLVLNRSVKADFRKGLIITYLCINRIFWRLTDFWEQKLRLSTSL